MAEYVQYKPTRSLIYTNCVREEYRHRLQNWLYQTHVPDSISQFAPYVSGYAFYNALPAPPEGERFGTATQQLTEHYWVADLSYLLKQTKTFEEIFPLDVLRWQGNIPDVDPAEMAALTADESRAVQGDNGGHPFVGVVVPVWWEEDLKGKGRTIADGPNYRWQFVLKYPEGVSFEDGEKWFYQMIEALKNNPLCNRILSSKVIKEMNDSIFDRVVEIWFDGPEEWYDAVVKNQADIPAPEWIDKCSQDVFPYLKPWHEFNSIFITDYASSNNLTSYRGYLTVR